jgi:hypothetical protein
VRGVLSCRTVPIRTPSSGRRATICASTSRPSTCSRYAMRALQLRQSPIVA